MTIKNRPLVVLRVEQHYDNKENKGKPFSGDARKKAEEYAMKMCEINEEKAIALVGKIAQRARGEIIMPECTRNDRTANRKGNSFKELVKASNEGHAPTKKAWQQNDQKTDPERYRKRSREYYQDNPDFADGKRKRMSELRTNKRHAKEDDLQQAAKAVRDLGEKQTRDDVLDQVYGARPDNTRNAQELLDKRYAIFHVTQVAPHELKPAGLLERRDSHLEARTKKKRKKKLTKAQIKSFAQVWGTPVSLAKAIHRVMNLHGGSKVNLEKDLHVYAITESHRQYDTFKQHTMRGKNGVINDAPKNGEHFVCARENIAVGESEPGVAVLRIPWTNDNKPVPDIKNLEVMYCNAGK
jgi:hypothetical protein